MLRISFEVSEEKLSEVARYYSSHNRLDVTVYPLNFGEFKYRNMVKIDYGRSSMTMGLGFNGTNREDQLKGFIEFNPNKVMDSPMINQDIGYLLSRCVDYSVVRWDLAVDIPFDRERIHMVRDKRKFEMSLTSYENRTEYLGQRNAVGRVKLYNKTIESKLDYSLTRLEVTMGKFEDFYSDFERFIPEVWTDDAQGELVDYTGLSQTQRLLAQLLRDSPTPEYYLKTLGYRMRKKLEPYIVGDDARLEFDRNIVYKIITHIQDFLKEVSNAEWEYAQKGSQGALENELENPFEDG